MRWEVVGLDRDTARERAVLVEADSQSAAEAAANRVGIFVESAAQLDTILAYESPKANKKRLAANSERRLALASAIFAVIATLLAWIPIVSIPLGGVGLLLGVVMWIVAADDLNMPARRFAAFGTLMSVVALIFSSMLITAGPTFAAGR